MLEYLPLSGRHNHLILIQLRICDLYEMLNSKIENLVMKMNYFNTSKCLEFAGRYLVNKTG